MNRFKCRHCRKHFKYIASFEDHYRINHPQEAKNVKLTLKEESTCALQKGNDPLCFKERNNNEVIVENPSYGIYIFYKHGYPYNMDKGFEFL